MSYIIKTRDDFLIDGISALEYGLAAEMPQPVPPAKQRYTTWQSGDTDHSTPDDSFEDVRYTITARRIKTPDDFRASDLYAALATAKTLQITRNAGRYYRISRLMDVQPMAAYHGNEITYKITFMLSPFAYHTENPEFTPQDSVIVNPGTRYSRPLYHITQHETPGYGYDEEATITVNGQALKIYFPDSYSNPIDLIVDAERMIAYSIDNPQFPDGENWTRYTYGFYPFLSPGTNAITYTGCSVKVTGNWRDY